MPMRYCTMSRASAVFQFAGRADRRLYGLSAMLIKSLRPLSPTTSGGYDLPNRPLTEAYKAYKAGEPRQMTLISR